MIFILGCSSKVQTDKQRDRALLELCCDARKSAVFLAHLSRVVLTFRRELLKVSEPLRRSELRAEKRGCLSHGCVQV